MRLAPASQRRIVSGSRGVGRGVIGTSPHDGQADHRLLAKGATELFGPDRAALNGLFHSIPIDAAYHVQNGSKAGLHLTHVLADSLQVRPGDQGKTIPEALVQDIVVIDDLLCP